MRKIVLSRDMTIGAKKSLDGSDNRGYKLSMIKEMANEAE
jgi:hypothetical protein